MENESEMPGWHGIPHRPDLELLLNLDDHDLGNYNHSRSPPLAPGCYLYTSAPTNAYELHCRPPCALMTDALGWRG